MKVILDTNAALFLWAAPARLSPAARALLEDAGNTLIFSQVSTWEICLKHQIGKLPLPEKPGPFIRKRLERDQLVYEPISDDALFASVELPKHHADPFDRLLIATAALLRVPIVTSDPQFKAYPIDVIW
ncbi:MAG: type II toxin-antitoxin system VapC family toxin [Opitutaceae bacterium]|nr:type II toxin-antitoxin system VapC family toxin [Opitutaceae bacterium]